MTRPNHLAGALSRAATNPKPARSDTSSLKLGSHKSAYHDAAKIERSNR
jgi:hypothetical protein